jgi:hypothetical protein
MSDIFIICNEVLYNTQLLERLREYYSTHYLILYFVGPCRLVIYIPITNVTPVPVSAQSKAFVCGRSPAEIMGSNPTGGMVVGCECLCCQVEVSVTGRSLVQRSPTVCGASLCVI